jgi:hypothetical protein
MNLNQVLNSTEFKPNMRMFKVYYKTAPCRFGSSCKYSDICYHYHSDDDKRYPTCMSFYTDNGDCRSPDYCIRGYTHEKKLPRMPQELHDSLRLKLEENFEEKPNQIPDKYKSMVDKACKRACEESSHHYREEFRNRERKNEKLIDNLKHDLHKLEDDNYDLKQQIKKRKLDSDNDKTEIENLKRLNNYLIQQIQYNNIMNYTIPRPPPPTSSFN